MGATIAVVFGGISGANAAGSGDGFVTREGNQLQLGGEQFRFAGSNMYWLGLDDNLRDGSDAPTYPTKYRVDNGFAAAKSMNATVIRTHSLGISVGCAQCLEPSRGVFNDKAFDSIDYAIAAAGKNNIKLMIPLTDQWKWYHGGKHTFTAWAGYPENTDASVNAANNEGQKKAEANFYTDPKVIADFQQYIAYLMNHKNAYTGIALKDDPTIMAWETGNEIWDAPIAWTEQIAKFIKTDVKAKQLVADGTAATGMTTGKAALDAEHIDIVGGHFYPMDINWMTADAKIAAGKNKAYIVGEYDWTNLNALPAMLSAVENDKNIAGDLTWVTLPYKEDGTPIPHGEHFNLYVPATDDNMRKGEASLGAHAQRMRPSSKPTPTTGAPTTKAPVISSPTTKTPEARPAVTTPAPAPTNAPAAPSGTTLNDSAFGYTGTWKVGSGSTKFQNDDHYASQVGALATVRFTGTGFSLFGSKAAHHGIVAVSVDGGAPIELDQYAASRMDQAHFFTADGLTNGEHTVTVRVTGSKNTASTGTVISLDRLTAQNGSTIPIATGQSLDDSALAYNGPWTVGSGTGKFADGDHYSNTTGAAAAVQFQGSRVVIRGAKASHHGTATVWIDGANRGTIDEYASNRSDDAVLFDSGTLTTGGPIVTIKVNGQKNPASSGTVIAIGRLVVF